MRQDGLTLGGEQSGHVILRDHTTTGDGLMTGLAVFGVMVENETPLSELAGQMQMFPQAMESILVTQRTPLEQLEGTQKAIDEIESQLGDEGRVLVRYSGTQMLARVMVEGPTDAVVNGAVAQISEAMRKDVG
jgi:phosphoglucosamine mutase